MAEYCSREQLHRYFSLRKSGPPLQILEARVRAQVIPLRLDLQKDHAGVSLLERTLEPDERFLALTPGRYKSKRYCEGIHDARLIALTVLRAQSALLPVSPTLPKHSRAMRASGNWRPRVLSLFALRRRLRGTF